MDSQPNVFEPAVTPEEWQKVPREIGRKLVDFVNEKFEEFITSKALFETKSFNFEQHSTELKTQVETLSGENENLKARLAAAAASIDEFQSQIATMSAELARLHAHSNQLESDAANYRHQRNLAVDERDECFKMTERRKAELERMQMDLDTLTKQLEDATRTKCEALAEAEEVKSMKVSLEYREKRLQQEREQMQMNLDGVTSDLKERTEELLNLRRDITSRNLKLETKLSEKLQELAVAVDQNNSLLELNQTLTTRNEELAQKLLHQNETHVKTNESYVCEIEAKTKMANVYRAMSEQSQKHAEELQKALTEVQELLNLNTEKYGELETKLKESELSCEEIVAKKNDYIAMLTKELETANEVIEECKNESFSRDIQGVSSMSANVSRGLTNDSSGRTMSYTTLYSHYVQAKEQLATKDEECARLNNYIACIVKEVEEKGPLIKQLRSEYSDCLDLQETLKSENEALTAELEQLREERAENHRMESKVARDNQRMKKEVADLSRQVVHLLQEVENSRIGSSSALSSDNDMSDSVSSADIISKRLVTFNDIAELQSANQKLLALVRELTERQEEVESYDPAAVANLQQKLKELQESQMELLEEREQQAKMMTMLRNQRDMYKKSFGGHDMIGAGGDLSFSNMPHQDDSIATKSQQSDSKSDEEVHELKRQIEKYKKQLDQAKEEYDQYRKERLEHEKIILEQIETMRNESKELQKANGKLASQAEYNEERFKVLQNNTEVYKKQIQALEKQNKIFSEALIKHEHTASYLKEEALQNQSKANKAEVQLANLIKENSMLRDAEKRLTRESEMLRRHAQQQNLITSNIELIKATLERNEAESKIRLESKLDEAHLECSALRRRLEEEQNHFRELTQHLEKATKQAQERMEENQKEADKLREELAETRQELSNKTCHIENLSKQLKSSVFQIQDVGVESRKLREIQQQLADSQAEVNTLKLKLKSTKEASENYFNIAQNAEKQLKDLSTENEKYSQTITEKEQQVQQLTDKLAELQAELSIQMDDQDINSADIKNQKQQLQEELQGQSLTLKQTREQLELAKGDLKLLSEQLKASEHKYAREVALHSSDLQLLQDLKQELQEAKDSYAATKLRTSEAEENLKETISSKDEQMAILNAEKERLEIRFKSIDEQNTLLLDQIEALNKQLTIIQGQADHNSSANSSLIEDSANSNQLLTILKYLRQEKDLAVSKADVVEAEHIRLKSQFEAVKNQLQEVQSLYEAERQKSEVENVTAMKHAEVLRQLETFNAVADSNRSLRQERDALANDVRELQARADQLEVAVAPLQETNRDLMQKADQMQTENISLRAECTRWRQRANLLIEKTNRTSPEDWKKLQTERETLAKQLTIERGNNAKLTEENNTLKARLDKMEQEVKSLQKQNHGLVEEVSRLKEQVAALGSNLKQVQENRDEVNKTNAKLTEDNRVFSEELTVKETAVTELKNNLAQVKKIAKKYKTQYEEQLKEIEAMKEQQSEQTLNKEKQLEERAVLEERLSQLENSHKEALEQFRIEKEEQEQNFIKEMEAQKQTSLEKEDKFKTLFKSAKERIVTLTEQNTALLNEIKQETNRSSSSSNTVGVSVNTDGSKDADLMEKIQQLEQEKEELQEKLQQEKLARAQELEALKLKPNSCSSAMMSSDKSSMDRPTADIKPIPGHSTNTQTQSVPIQPWRSVGEPPLASIRPMSQQLRTAAVLPTTQTPSAAVMVPPQQQVHTTGSSSIEALSSSSPTSSHTDYVPATSSAGSPMLNPRQIAVPPTQSSEDDADGGGGNVQAQPAPTQQQALAVVSPRVEPPAAQEQGTSSSSSNTVTTTQQAGLKRQRDTDTDSCQAEEKNAIKQQSKRTRLQQASDSGLEVEYQVPTSSQRDQDDDNVIVLESDDDAGPDEGDCDDQDEPDEAEVYDDMEEGMEQDNYDDDDDCQDVEDEEEADNEVEVISDSSEVPNQSHGETEEACEAAENSMDEEQAQSEAISSGTDAAAASSGPSSSSFSPAAAVAAPSSFSRSRLVPPLHRHPPTLLDESALDDGIVPSTPTLFAPRRSDGFGEAVSSPHVPSSAVGQRFTFNESQSAQPSSRDYSSSEVPQVDDNNSTGRSVPTTPLQSSPQESIPNLSDEHGGDGQAQSDAEIPQISIDEEENRGEASSAEARMGPPSQAGTSSEENRQENEVEVEDAVSSEGEKPASQAEKSEEEGREAEASPSPNEVTRSSRSAARRSTRMYPSTRGPQQRMGPTPIVWGGDHRQHPPNRLYQQQQHERNRSPNYGGGNNRSMARRPRTRMQRPPFGGRF